MHGEIFSLIFSNFFNIVNTRIDNIFIIFRKQSPSPFSFQCNKSQLRNTKLGNAQTSESFPLFVMPVEHQ